MASNPIKNKLYAWTNHGVSNGGDWTSDEKEYFTECLFCSTPNKLYINPEKMVFDCKVCGLQGGYIDFLGEVHKLNKTSIKEHHIEALSEDRGLPTDAFRNLELGWNGTHFTIPVYDVEGSLVGLDFYLPGEKIVHSFKPAKISLYNAPKLKEHLNGPIILCEGLWDALAMEWLLKELDIKGTVIAVPGANINIKDWEYYFFDKKVIILYDHDLAGREGEFKIWQLLSTKADLSFIHWPEGKSKGYDVRDLVCKWGIQEGNPKKAYRLIKNWLSDVPRRMESMATMDAQGKLSLERRKEKLVPLSFQELTKFYQDYLYMPNMDAVRILLGTIYANRFRSDMVWMFLVAPPSSGKSELILSLEGTPEVEHISTVTEHTFVSGYIGAGNTDVSLFDKLRNRMAAIKDFTPILQTIAQKQQQIFGVLRDAYDGRIDAMYGHANNRRYTGLHFGIIAGVTSEIENFGKMQQSLGERFLRYYLPNRLQDKVEKSKKSEENIGFEKAKRTALKHAVYRFLETNKGSDVPKRSDRIKEQIRHIANFTVALRAVVPRDFKERVQYTPTEEGPMRVTKQLNLLAMGLACLEKKTDVGGDEVRLIKEVALSTCPDIVKTVVRALYDAQIHPLSIKNLEDNTGFPYNTLKYVMDDLRMLGIVDKLGASFKTLYQLSTRAKELIVLGNIYAPEKKRIFLLRSKVVGHFEISPIISPSVQA